MASINKMAVLEIIRKIGLEDGDVDFLKEGLKVLTQAVMDAEVSSVIGAERYERSGHRKNRRNGYREREWDTRVGAIDLQIPKLRKVPQYFRASKESRKGTVICCLRSIYQRREHSESG